MSARKRTSPQDWIQDYYSPILTVLASQDAEAVASKNNLTVTEILQPFSKLGSDVTIKDADGSNHNVPSLHLILQDFKKDAQKLINQKLMLERMSEENCEESEMVSKHYDKISLDAPGFTTWFDVWMKMYLQTLPVVEQEYLRHEFGCIFVVSTECESPVEQLRQLVQAQHRHQHDRVGSEAHYFAPNIIKCYILVHDTSGRLSELQAQNMFTQVQNAFDSSSCHFLALNSRPVEEASGPTSLADHWLQFSHRLNTAELRRTPGAINQSHKTNNFSDFTENTTEKGEPPLEHPLALSEPPESPLPLQQNSIKLTQATSANLAVCLDPTDVDRIRILMRDLVLKSVIPFAEKQIKQLTEFVANRKSRSLFSGAKRWFGSNKPNAAAGTSLVYTKDAPELQVRKLADLYFLMKMYKSAHNYYYIAKKDFQADEAWPYYATAVEFAALSMFMVAGSEPGKKYRCDYMEDSITKYLTICQTPEFAVRATLFDALCLKQQGMFIESANSYIRMTNELSDLRSAMLLEQAAYCFLLASPPNIRKYGFHIVLAGYRFTKTGSCKKHAARLYRQGAQVYDGKGWLLSSEHILYSLGHQKFMLKDFSTSAEFFNSLMTVSTGRNHLQQMIQLREYFLVHHARFKEDQAVVVITIPNILSQEVCVSLSGAHPHLNTENWQALERSICEGISGREILVMSNTCQPYFSNSTQNNLKPQGVVGEQIVLSVRMENKFRTPLQLRKSHLLWKFTNSAGEVFSNDKRNEQDLKEIQVSVLESITLESNSVTTVDFQMTGHTVGVLNIIGLEYSIKALFPDKEPTDHQIRGKQYFQISGPRQNTVKDHKTKIVYGEDHRLTVVLRPPQPLLSARMKSPESLLSGEMRCIEVELENLSSVGLRHLHLVSTRPGLVSFGKPRQPPLFEFPLVTKNETPMRVVNPDGSVSQVYLDVLLVPLPEGHMGQLAAKTTVSLPIWIRVETELETESVAEDFYFYYENAEPAAGEIFVHRIHHVPLTLKVLPSLLGSATGLCIPVLQNLNGSNILIRLKNVSKEGTESLEKMDISQVVLVSSNCEISSLECSGRSGNLARGDAVTLAFKSTILDNQLNCDNVLNVAVHQNRDLEGGSLHFSSLATRQNRGHSIHSPPFVDFLKPYFVFNIGKKRNPPFLKGDLVVVMWRGQSSHQVLGQTVLPVEGTPGPRQHRSLGYTSHQPVTVKLVYPKQTSHNFSASPFAGVNLQVEFSRNIEREAESGPGARTLVQFCLKNVERGIKWTGVTEGLRSLVLDPLVLNLGINVSKSGLFCLKNLHFRAKKLIGKNEPSQFDESDEFSCLDVSFTVLPVS